MDLASEWFAWTGLPFVFAAWGIGREVPEADRLWLGRFLDAALDQTGREIQHLVQDLPRDLGSPADLTTYLGNITHRLGPDEEAGLNLFRRLLLERGLTRSD
jgi:chorismate dehydratase